MAAPSSPSASASWPRHLALALVLHDYTGQSDVAAEYGLSVSEGSVVLVQGERTDAPEGWVWALLKGQEGLLPSGYLQPQQSATSFRVQALYDFTAAEANELSFITGEYLQLLPSVDDPPGWCTAAHRHTRENGLVPAAYVEPTNLTLPLTPLTGGGEPQSRDRSQRAAAAAEAQQRWEATSPTHAPSPACGDGRDACGNGRGGGSGRGGSGRGGVAAASRAAAHDRGPAEPAARSAQLPADAEGTAHATMMDRSPPLASCERNLSIAEAPSPLPSWAAHTPLPPPTRQARQAATEPPSPSRLAPAPAVADASPVDAVRAGVIDALDRWRAALRALRRDVVHMLQQRAPGCTDWVVPLDDDDGEPATPNAHRRRAEEIEAAAAQAAAAAAAQQPLPALRLRTPARTASGARMLQPEEEMRIYTAQQWLASPGEAARSRARLRAARTVPPPEGFDPREAMVSPSCEAAAPPPRDRPATALARAPRPPAALSVARHLTS